MRRFFYFTDRAQTEQIRGTNSSNKSIDENLINDDGNCWRNIARFGIRVKHYARIIYVTRALNSGYIVASDHVAIDLDQGY